MDNPNRYYRVLIDDANCAPVRKGDIMKSSGSGREYLTIYSTHPNNRPYYGYFWVFSSKNLEEITDLHELEKLIYNIRD